MLDFKLEYPLNKVVLLIIEEAVVQHPKLDKGALTIDRVRSGMTLYHFDFNDRLLGKFVVQAIEEFSQGMHALNGVYTPYDVATGVWAEQGSENYNEAASNLGLEPGAGPWMAYYSLDEATYQASLS